MPWGPLIKHNGDPVPHLVGKRVLAMTDDGVNQEAVPVDGYGGSWTWRNNLPYSHVIAYRVWEQGEDEVAETALSAPQPF